MVLFKLFRFTLSAFVAVMVLVLTIQAVMAAPKEQKPIAKQLLKSMKERNVDIRAPIYMRAFKKEGIIEIWKQSRYKTYALVAIFPICTYSGNLGPKMKEGDNQTPEGFYTITPGLMHPKSNYHLAFNIGFPNQYDRANNRTGSYIMVHGKCKSIGCFAMTDGGMEQIFAFAREAFKAGQPSFEFHSFPFKMTEENMAKYENSPNKDFWLSLKPAYDLFEQTRQPPHVIVCGKSYVISSYDKMPECKL